MDGNSEQLQVINLKQLPIIEERLRDIKAKIEQRTSAVMALAVTEKPAPMSRRSAPKSARSWRVTRPSAWPSKGHYDPLRTV